jgi:phage tail-like protein
MAVNRGRPYSQFNFLVQIDGGPAANTIEAGFQEVSGLGLEISVAEYRTGNFQDNTPMKITGTYKNPDVTMKRGVLGELGTFHEWVNQVRNGRQDQLRTITIQLQNEDHSAVVQEWTLTNARPIKYTGPSLSGKGTDVAVEEVVFASERIVVS